MFRLWRRLALGLLQIGWLLTSLVFAARSHAHAALFPDVREIRQELSGRVTPILVSWPTRCAVAITNPTWKPTRRPLGITWLATDQSQTVMAGRGGEGGSGNKAEGGMSTSRPVSSPPT
jgi:hypothetical protein